MIASPSTAFRSLRAPGYLILTIAALIPIADYLTTLWPPVPGKLAWRFGAAGLASGAFAVPLLILLLIFALSVVLNDRKVSLTVGAIAGTLGVVMLASIIMFALDAMQMQRSIAPAAQSRFKVASVQAIVKLLLHGVSGIVLALAAFRSVRVAAQSSSRHSRSGSHLLVTMTGESPRVSAPTTPVPIATGAPSEEPAK